MSERVVIPVICHIRKQGTEIRCTLSPQHSGAHRNVYGRIDWPRRPGETQAS
ncbi:hypothetical protein ACIBKX_40385 [Streptomyces sp. NPDC050658]|uniref:hypothetical protein n=1 Tax=unclassified Streptomyces TaxID=2593676 RepID=UPI00341E96AE